MYKKCLKFRISNKKAKLLKVIAENGQEIEVSLLVDGEGVHISYERLEQGEGIKTLSISLNQSGVEIQNSFLNEVDPTE